jgi:hypothetical protein
MTISTEAFLAVSVGSSANDGTGDSLRAAFIKVNTNFSNIGDIGFDAGNIIVQGSLVLGNSLAPTGNSSATGTAGQIVWDSGNVYVCVATNTWKRATLSSY